MVLSIILLYLAFCLCVYIPVKLSTDIDIIIKRNNK